MSNPSKTQSLQLTSISGNASDFHPSFFKSKVGPQTTSRSLNVCVWWWGAWGEAECVGLSLCHTFVHGLRAGTWRLPAFQEVRVYLSFFRW